MASANRQYSSQTLKVLFALSGNQCAHPACTNSVIAPGDKISEPLVVAQICHIYAASVDGPRGRRDLTNQQKNSPANLLLLCPTHHRIVDGQFETYPADLLKAWKQRHEARIRGFPGRIAHFSGVPIRIHGFAGRRSELKQLHTILGTERPAAITHASGRAAVYSLGGVGKTSLAVEYANEFRHFYAGVWWCDAESSTSLLTRLAALATTLGETSTRESDIEKAALVALRRLGEQATPWLIVYDNVETPDEIANLIPPSPTRLLITSRFSDWSGWAEAIELEVLPLDEAARFLQDRAGRKDPVGARTLAEALGRLPLALDHAAAYSRRAQISFLDYATKVETLIASAPKSAVYPKSVAATFGLAIEDVIRRCPTAERLASFLAFCAPARIPLALATGAFDHAGALDDTLTELVEVSLVKRDTFDYGTPAVTMHRLVQAVARARSAASRTSHEIIGRLIERLNSIYPEDGYQNPSSWRVCAQLAPHVLNLMYAEKREIQMAAPTWPPLLARVGTYLHGRCAFSAAEPVLRESVRLGEELLGTEHSEMGPLLNDLAILLRDIDRNSPELEALFRRSLAIGEKTLPEDHSSLGLRTSNLANVLRDTGRHGEAEQMYRRAIEIGVKCFEREHPSVATRLHNFAGLLRKINRLPEAEEMLREAMAIDEKTLGRGHHSFATDLNSLAMLLVQIGQYDEAEGLYQEAVKIRETTLGKGHALTHCVVANLARVFSLTGRPTEALAPAQGALRSLHSQLGLSHAWTVDCAAIVVEILEAMGDTSDAAAVRKNYSLAAR
jgi:tetratricopeptide (TPR) repeat protein